MEQLVLSSTSAVALEPTSTLALLQTTSARMACPTPSTHPWRRSRGTRGLWWQGGRMRGGGGTRRGVAGSENRSALPARLTPLVKRLTTPGQLFGHRLFTRSTLPAYLTPCSVPPPPHLPPRVAPAPAASQRRPRPGETGNEGDICQAKGRGVKCDRLPGDRRSRLWVYRRGASGLGVGGGRGAFFPP